MANQMPPSILEALRRLAPGTDLREGFERVLQQRTGALVVIGGNASVDSLCTGGFRLRDTEYTPQRLAELAKMDGAIVLSADGDRVEQANVHLIPDSSIPTNETGTRHRTAERFALQTGAIVVSVSEGRKRAIVFTPEGRLDLDSPAVLLPRANQMIQTLERLRSQFDHHVAQLDVAEVRDSVTYGMVAAIIQRAEVIRRLADEINDLTVALGPEGNLIRFQAADFTHSTGELANLVIGDYVRGRTRNRTLDAISRESGVPVGDIEAVAGVYKLGGLEEQAKPAGLRILGRVPGLPNSVKRGLVVRFRNLSRMLSASTDALSSVEGVGAARARQLFGFFEALREEAGLLHEDI
jgi:diadenylate cyclase